MPCKSHQRNIFLNAMKDYKFTMDLFRQSLKNGQYHTESYFIFIINYFICNYFFMYMNNSSQQSLVSPNCLLWETNTNLTLGFNLNFHCQNTFTSVISNILKILQRYFKQHLYLNRHHRLMDEVSVEVLLISDVKNFQHNY